MGPRFEGGQLLISSFENHGTKMFVDVSHDSFVAFREGRPAPGSISSLLKRPAVSTPAARKKPFSEGGSGGGSSSGDSDCQVVGTNSGQH